MRFSSNTDDENVEIQMTPMIDCVFLLLIFFLVATVLKKIDNELKVDLPISAAAMKTPTENEMLIISIDSEGKFHIGAAPVSLEMLHSKLKEVARENKDRRVRIDGDKKAPFQSLVHIMDLCKFEGLTNVGIHTHTPKN